MNNRQVLLSTAEHYLRTMHPEYEFVFSVEAKAIEFWGYDAEKAKTLRSNMIAMACSHARKLDAANGIDVIIQDESC